MGRKIIAVVLCLTVLVIIIAGCSNSSSNNSNSSNNGNPGATFNWLADQDKALLEAQSQNKPILINFFTDACPACRQMDRTTFTDEELLDFLNTNFINLKSNAGKTPLYQRYSITAVPTFVFSTPDGFQNEYVITKSVGYRSADQFYVLAQAVLSTWQS